MAQFTRVYDFLPPPFEWCPVPAGRVTIKYLNWDINQKGEREQSFDVPAFEIAKYPVTNAQYQVFVDAGDGYSKSRWWDYSEDAKDWREQNAIPEHTAFPGDDCPRTYMCWYSAVAFCRWLSFKTSETIMLPTEQQWQWAAQGDDGRKYPWGNEEPNETRCNFNRNVRRTTSVTRYPIGASPYGVLDMGGNVLEWCLSITGDRLGNMDLSRHRVLRGGSWYSGPGGSLVTSHSGDLPFERFTYYGFRLARW